MAIQHPDTESKANDCHRLNIPRKKSLSAFVNIIIFLCNSLTIYSDNINTSHTIFPDMFSLIKQSLQNSLGGFTTWCVFTCHILNVKA